MRHTDLTNIDLPTLKEMFKDLEDENEQAAVQLTSISNGLSHHWSDIRALRDDCQTWGQCWQKKKDMVSEQ